MGQSMKSCFDGVIRWSFYTEGKFTERNVA